MLGKTRAFLLSLTAISVLIFSAIGPTIVYADDGTTPEAPATETAGKQDDAGAQATTEATSTPEKVSAGSTADSTEAAADTTQEAPAEAADQSAASEEAAPTTDSNLLGDVPDNTTVTVLNADGKSQPLATQDAADAIATTSDPIWCPQGQDPTPGSNGCTPSFNSFDALLTFLSENATFQGAGTIYVQEGAYNGGESSIDLNSASYDLSRIRNADLNVTGGWNTSSNTVSPSNPSTFHTPILIGTSTNPWGGSLSISNITISDTSATGLTLFSQGNILLSDVNIMRSESGAGAELTADGDVTVIDSNFDSNSTGGAKIKAGGRVDVVDSSFTDPGNLQWQGRQAIGLDIVSGGETTLVGILASGNSMGGTNINSGGAVTIVDSIFSGNKSLQGTVFEGYGLQVITAADIALDGVTADDNFLWGAKLDTTQGNGNIDIVDSQFNANTTASPGFIDDTGLFIYSGGSVALNNIVANDNRLFGAQIDSVGSVSINGGTFNNNRGIITDTGVTTYNGHGLQITSQADIALTDVTATNNMLFGAQLNAGGGVDIGFSTFSNTSTGSSANALGRGLEVTSTGLTTLFEVLLDNNQTAGAVIQAGNGVSLTNVTATDNGSDGVLITAACTELIGGTYTGNGGYGLNLGTSALSQDGSTVFSGNSAGSIFPSNPANCAFGAGGNTASANNVFTSLQVPVTGSQNATLSSLMTKNGSRSIFIGKYDYVHTTSGMQIIAYESSSNELAMSGS